MKNLGNRKSGRGEASSTDADSTDIRFYLVLEYGYKITFFKVKLVVGENVALFDYNKANFGNWTAAYSAFYHERTFLKTADVSRFT